MQKVMITLGVDYGERKIGLALAEKSVAFPYGVVRFRDKKKAIDRLAKTVFLEGVERIVVGVSEGRSEARTREFVDRLKTKVNIPVELWNETLSTRIAQNLAIEAGLARHKRRKLEDAYAAAVILQDYLDSEG